MKNKMHYLDIPFEIKTSLAEDPDYYYIEGYGSTFGNVDLGQDVVVKGAFTKSLKDRMPKMVYQHDMSQPIGVWDEATENEKGLYLKGRLPKANRQVQDIMSLVKMGAIDSFSIGFGVAKGGSEVDGKGVRYLKQLNLYEVSPVTLPMNPSAKVTGMKEFNVEDVEDITTKRELEELLIEAGFSKKAAGFIISKTAAKLGDPDALVDTQTEDEIKAAANQGDPDKRMQEIIKSLNSITQII